MNKLILIGRIGKDLEIKKSNETVYTQMSLCVRRITNKTKNENEWFNVTVFGKQAENCCKYLKKGMRTVVEAHLQNNQYETEDGTVVRNISIIADRVEFIDWDKSLFQKEVSQQSSVEEIEELSREFADEAINEEVIYDLIPFAFTIDKDECPF